LVSRLENYVGSHLRTSAAMPSQHYESLVQRGLLHKLEVSFQRLQDEKPVIGPLDANCDLSGLRTTMTLRDVTPSLDTAKLSREYQRFLSPGSSAQSLAQSRRRGSSSRRTEPDIDVDVQVHDDHLPNDELANSAVMDAADTSRLTQDESDPTFMDPQDSADAAEQASAAATADAETAADEQVALQSKLAVPAEELTPADAAAQTILDDLYKRATLKHAFVRSVQYNSQLDSLPDTPVTKAPGAMAVADVDSTALVDKDSSQRDKPATKATSRPSLTRRQRVSLFPVRWVEFPAERMTTKQRTRWAQDVYRLLSPFGRDARATEHSIEQPGVLKRGLSDAISANDQPSNPHFGWFPTVSLLEHLDNAALEAARATAQAVHTLADHTERLQHSGPTLPKEAVDTILSSTSSRGPVAMTHAPIDIGAVVSRIRVPTYLTSRSQHK